MFLLQPSIFKKVLKKHQPRSPCSQFYAPAFGAWLVFLVSFSGLHATLSGPQAWRSPWHGIRVGRRSPSIAVGNGCVLAWEMGPWVGSCSDLSPEKPADLSYASDDCQLFKQKVFLFKWNWSNTFNRPRTSPSLITSASENRLHSLNHTDTTEIFIRLMK